MQRCGRGLNSNWLFVVGIWKLNPIFLRGLYTHKRQISYERWMSITNVRCLKVFRPRRIWLLTPDQDQGFFAKKSD